jgi:hypothetical protein
MNERELHEKISEWFEPKPEYCEAHASTYWDLNHDKEVVIPLDYTHSEEANAVLLEAMSVMRIDRYFKSHLWVATALTKDSIVVSASDTDRKTAIRDAFVMWAKLKCNHQRPFHHVCNPCGRDLKEAE